MLLARSLKEKYHPAGANFLNVLLVLVILMHCSMVVSYEREGGSNVGCALPSGYGET